MTFFSLLASAPNPDARTLLTESYVLIPALVAYLAQLTEKLDEEDYDSESGPVVDQTRQDAYRHLARALFLLHHIVLVRPVDPDVMPSSSPTVTPPNPWAHVVDLKLKLHQAPTRPFTALTHVFIVTFGRLSYADAPVWVRRENGETRDVECVNRKLCSSTLLI